MTLPLLLIAQMSATMLPEAPIDVRASIAKPCDQNSDEITVCGRESNEAFRLRPLHSDKFEPKPLRATIGIGSGAVDAETERKEFGQGNTSKRIMARLKFKF